MGRLDFTKALYDRPHTSSSIVAEVDSILGSGTKDVRVTCIPFSCEAQPFAEFVRKLNKYQTVTLIQSSDSLDSFELQYSYKDGGERKAETGRFFVYHHHNYPNVFTAITIDGSRFVSRGLTPFLRKRFPKVVMGFLPQARLKRILTTFRAENEFSELIITRAVQRLRLPDEGNHRRVMPVTSWPNMALDEAIDWLVEHNGWFHSVQFDAKRDKKTLTQVSLTREGIVKCDVLFELVWRAFVLPICKMHHENFNLFSKRGRRENTDLAARPLAIRFEDDQFADIAENKTLILAMRTYENASISVLHGNPYIHLGVIDYLDGSGFDIWVVDSKELVIVPQMHGSIGAIKRLVNHIYDTYAEGEIADYLSGS